MRNINTNNRKWKKINTLLRHHAKACERATATDESKTNKERRNKWREIFFFFTTLRCVDWSYKHTDFSINVTLRMSVAVVDIRHRRIKTNNNNNKMTWTKLYKSISSFEFIIQKINTKFGYESNHTGDQIPCANYTSQGCCACMHSPHLTSRFHPLVCGQMRKQTRLSIQRAVVQKKKQNRNWVIFAMLNRCQTEHHKSYDMCSYRSSYVVSIIITEYKLPLNPE